MADQTIEIEGRTDVCVEEYIGGFEGESEPWTRVFLTVLAGAAVDATAATAAREVVQGAEDLADAAEKLLRDRAGRRAKQAQARTAKDRTARDAAAVKVREIGAFVGTSGDLYDVTEIDSVAAMLTKRGDLEHRSIRIKVEALVDPDFLLEEHALVAAPEAQRTEIVVRLKAAAILDCRAEDVTLTWIPGGVVIHDVEVRGMRPLPATWAKLVEAGLPIYPYGAAVASWSTEA